MPRCSAYGCRSGYDSTCSKDRHYFGIPKQTAQAEKWSAALAREGTTLGPKCLICDLHFVDDVLLKNYEHVVEGKLVVIPRGRWGLKPGAVPTLRLANGVEQPAKRKRKRKLLTTVIDPAEKLEADERFVMLREKLSDCKDLCGWSVHCGGDELIALCKMSVVDSLVVVEKAVIVHDDMEVTVNAIGRVVPIEYCLAASAGASPIAHVNDLEELVKLVTCLDALNVCSGCPADEDDAVDSGGSEQPTMYKVYSENCHVLSQQPVCPQCEKLKQGC